MSRYKAKSSAQAAITSLVPLSSPSSQRSIPNLLLRDLAAMAPKKATAASKGKAVALGGGSAEAQWDGDIEPALSGSRFETEADRKSVV